MFILFFDINLYLLGNYNILEKFLKIWFCGLFLFVDDFVVFELFEKFEVKFINKILYEKICYFIINKMISVLNGNCFLYIEFLKEGKYLFRINYCVGLCCKFFYFG